MSEDGLKSDTDHDMFAVGVSTCRLYVRGAYTDRPSVPSKKERAAQRFFVCLFFSLSLSETGFHWISVQQ